VPATRMTYRRGQQTRPAYKWIGRMVESTTPAIITIAGAKDSNSQQEQQEHLSCDNGNG